MAGIYIHIPFCKQACTYCNFHFSTNTSQINIFVDTLLKEILFKKNYLPISNISTIYFGGGTPSILSIKQLETILNTIHDHFIVEQNSEITLEVNPDNVTIDNILAWKGLGINRISLGVQSFDTNELIFMNRSHTATHSLHSIDLIASHFINFSVDLIFGSHLQSDTILQHNLQQLLQYNPPHISCYALTVEEKTVLSNQISKNKNLLPDQQKQHNYFYLIKETLEDNNYTHYEISNYAKPGYESKHNSNYWNGVPYIGLGPSAHSYNLNSRSWNIANNALYINASNNFDTIIETEVLTNEQKINEYIMVALRKNTGVSLDQLAALSTEKQLVMLNKSIDKHLQMCNISLHNNHIILTKEALILADGIASDLFIL